MIRAVALAVATAAGVLLLLLLAANAWVIGAAREHVYDDIQRLPVNEVGLVLGTSPYTRRGNRNLLFRHRMRAAAELYDAGKVRHLLLSGANPDETYNEPRKMYQALVALGVPPEAMTFDFAGFRTLDSVVRAREIFGLERVTVISQRFHNYRAVFIARRRGLEAVAYTRPEEDPRQPLRTEAREYLARGKAVLDLFVLFKRPKYLGERRSIDSDAAPPPLPDKKKGGPEGPPDTGPR
ncbi:sanA protein [Salinisphaera sp. PC39]|uniref:SanA/YdcF family protein n=1 Tax=Salinisphaera sp. PC39 TaxID=1304156 RepID=UPI0033413C60